MTRTERARRAVEQIRDGRTTDAHRLLAELASDGYPEARECLSEAERGRWSKAVALLRAMAEGKVWK